MLVYKLCRDGNNQGAMNLLECDTKDELQKIIDWLNKPRWVDSFSTKHNFTKEQMQDLEKSEKIFDYEADFDAYFYDFFKLGIDLTESDIDWFKFNWILGGIMGEESSAISQRLQARCYKPQKGENEKYKESMKKKKRLYSLVEENEWNKLSERG